MRSLTTLISWLVLLGLVACAACNADPIRTANSVNQNTKVEVLTEFDGIRLYRIHDGDSGPIYVAVTGSELRTTWNEQVGKTTVTRTSLSVQK